MSGKGRAVRIHISGTSPYGFRLLRGGQGQAIVTKLRPKSKAALAGLQDGDVVTAVNGYSCNHISHDRLMSLVEHAGHYIDLEVWRCSNDHSYSTSDHKWSTEWNRREEAPFSPTFDMLSSYDFDNRSDNILSPLDTDLEELSWTMDAGRRWSQDYAAPAYRKAQFTPTGNNVADFKWNADRSITMSLDLLDNKENREPPVTHRNEAFLMINSPPPSRQPVVWQPTTVRSQSLQPSTNQFNDSPKLSSERPSRSIWQDTSSDSGLNYRSKMFEPLPPEVVKIITASSDSESIPEEILNKKKKVYADSSFYSDSKLSYPTIEEQIKMARKVAQSLTSPVNQDTRGHRMFLKRKEALNVDDVDGKETPSFGNNRRNSSGGLYYNPMPWKSVGPWKPTTDGYDSSAPTSASLRLYSAASQIPTNIDDNRSKAMSADEFERVRLFDEKTTHDTVAPQVCFSLADDLRNSNSKGGRMFAKRRAKADQWTVENQPQQDTLVKITAQYAANHSDKMPAERNQLNNYFTVPEFQTQISRARITPWDAAVEYGNVDPAFEHLTDITFTKPRASLTGETNRSTFGYDVRNIVRSSPVQPVMFPTYFSSVSSAETGIQMGKPAGTNYNNLHLNRSGGLLRSN